MDQNVSQPHQSEHVVDMHFRFSPAMNILLAISTVLFAGCPPQIGIGLNRTRVAAATITTPRAHFPDRLQLLHAPAAFPETSDVSLLLIHDQAESWT